MEFLIVLALLGVLGFTWGLVARRLRGRNVVLRHAAGMLVGMFAMGLLGTVLAAAGMLEPQGVAPPEESDVIPTPAPKQASVAEPAHNEPPTPAVQPPPVATPVTPQEAKWDQPFVQPAPAQVASLGSLAAFRGWFEKLEVRFEPSPLADGTPRLLGKTSDRMTNVEIIGHRDILERASLMFALNQDDAPALVRTTGAIMVFMRELGWPGGHKWVIDQLKGEKATIVKNGVRYEVNSIESLGIFTLVAEPAGEPPR